MCTHKGNADAGILHSIWLVQCGAVFHYSHHNAGENPEMRTLFYRLCRLLRLHILGIFVFDGVDRAELKRGKKVKKTPHWLKEGFLDMLKLFGFVAHTVTRFHFQLYYFGSSWLVTGTC
jgi:Holliday junction resolvase YEN1